MIPKRGLTNRLREAVLEWYAQHGRDFPWRRTRDSFHVLIAETLLRQTQAERVVCPYTELVARYPDPAALANADANELRKWFRPLGLVRRADSMVAAAKLVVDRCGGLVPNELGRLLDLPGIGDYSARAILCLGFGQPLPMIDEGSGRVLRRVLDLDWRGPAYCDSGLLEVAERILPKRRAKEFNLGMIDIAAAFCHPRMPACQQCPLARLCLRVGE